MDRSAGVAQLSHRRQGIEEEFSHATLRGLPKWFKRAVWEPKQRECYDGFRKWPTGDARASLRDAVRQVDTSPGGGGALLFELHNRLALEALEGSASPGGLLRSGSRLPPCADRCFLV